ncbi:MAG: alpha/beta fold hydrolase, partial [Bacteroidota bacterium]
MKSSKISFTNKSGYKLSGKIELPVHTKVQNFAVFAHCFTCNKNFSAVNNISRALTQAGVGVLRFDFTGLGESEGDFADTNFSSNVEDLVVAAEYLSENYVTPEILIGHSLGGAAVLLARKFIPSIKAVATIGAPYDPAHVTALFQEGIEEIEKQGAAKVNIGGRSFQIKKQMVDDLEKQGPFQVINNLDAALLVMHSPEDSIVELDNATQIFKAAKHPRSFISLDGADHLLSRKIDSQYVGSLIAKWASKYVATQGKVTLETDSDVIVRTSAESYTTDIKAGNHYLTADEPEDVGGADLGPTPYGLLLAAIGACTSMTLKMYAARKNWDLKEVKVHLMHDKIYA